MKVSDFMAFLFLNCTFVNGAKAETFAASIKTSASWDYDILQYLKGGFDAGKQVVIYGHSRGGVAVVRIANALGEMNVIVTEMILFDPVSLGGDLVFNYPNVMKATNYYQRNPVDGVAFWANNPFRGDPVSGNSINNVNLTGHYYSPGVLINHINITDYAIKHP